MNNDKFDKLLDDEEEDNNFEEFEKKATKTKLDEEISMDDLFDFKPIGSVGDEEAFLKNSMKNSSGSEAKKKPAVTTRQQLESILDEKSEVTFLKEEKETKPVESSSESPMRKSIFKEEEVLFDEKQDKQQINEVEEELNFDEAKIKSLIESALYVCGNEGLSLNDLKRLTSAPTSEIKRIIKKWNDDLEKDETRGISIRVYGERYKLFSKNENREDLSRLITIKYRNPLSSKVMETLAIIAYNQPCTRAIIEDIRAKDPTATIQKLIDLGLVSDAGRADTPGRPILYTVTHKFYDIFGIKNLSELPKINIDQPFDDQDISFFDTTRFND